MAVPTNTFQTYQSIGMREDLSDIIFNIAPVETPFLSMLPKEKAKGRYHEWQTDTLASASGENKVIEGDDVSADAVTPTVRLGNYTQISDKSVQISHTAEKVDKAGRKSEMSYQVALRGKELKRDMETRLTGNYPSAAGAAGTARESAGFEAWIVTNDQRGATGADGGFSGGTVSAATDGTQRAFTETLLKAAIKASWTEGGNPDTIMVGAFNKQAASAFSGIATLYRDTGQSKKQASILGAADLYISDFGQHKIIANRFSRDRSALVVDSAYWSLAQLEPMKLTNLAKTGHSDQKLLWCEYALVSKNEKSSAIVADLTTA
jgi:hypothetical protein